MGRDYRFINFYRALAAYWVLVCHCMIWGGWYLSLVPPPKIAVDLFMMISGFLMAAHATARAAGEPLDRSRNWLRFWMRRFFRIAPAYYVSLAVAVILSPWFLGGYQAWIDLNPARWAGQVVYDPMRMDYSPASILAHVTFAFGLHPTLSFSTFLPDWSLSLEMQFYALFPLIWLLFRPFGVVPAALGLGALSVAAKHILEQHVHYYEPSLIILKLPYFLAGMVMFGAVQPSAPAIRRLALVAAGAVLVTTEFAYGGWLPLLPVLFLSMAGFGWLELSGRLPASVGSLIGSRAVHFASDTSFGLYLFHGFFISAGGLIVASSPALTGLGKFERVVALLLFVIPGTLAVAALVRRRVEIPGISFGRRLMDRSVRPDPGPGPAEDAPESRRRSGTDVSTEAAPTP